MLTQQAVCAFARLVCTCGNWQKQNTKTRKKTKAPSENKNAIMAGQKNGEKYTKIIEPFDMPGVRHI